ncbi:hypothetical protein [Nitrospirillum sp. BR 11828]|uniref:hypothetical protein n=1 Tax=Nitrospirillum sp. BR 11828 TaxID=3104325 RepID=UPI002ACA431E|nr:hypothetical protein [Nitrospirillum sp. BR 11828]MDZ5649479.1 hypothetical protein [Nitrospirillum sp. BR 11828]
MSGDRLRALLALGRMTLDEEIAMVHGNVGFILKKTRPDDKRIGAGHGTAETRLRADPARDTYYKAP